MCKNNTLSGSDKFQDLLHRIYGNILIHILESYDQHLLIIQQICKGCFLSVFIQNISIINVCNISGNYIDIEVLHSGYQILKSAAIRKCPCPVEQAAEH